MQIRAFTPYFVLIGLMIITALALAFTVDVTLSDKAGVSMKLPSVIEGGWVGDELRYSHSAENPQQYRVSELDLPNVDPVTGEKLFTMSLAEYEALPKDTEFVKSIYTNNAADQVFVSIVLSGRERDSIHRPERCLVGQGNTIVNQHFWNVLVPQTIAIPLEGRDKPLKVAVLEAVRSYRGPDGERKTYYSYYAYWFVGQNRETPSHYARMLWLAWDRVVHSVGNKWAYIAVSGEREEGSDAYKQRLTDFVQKLYPHLLINQQAGVDKP
jgi:hypothetical protein